MSSLRSCLSQRFSQPIEFFDTSKVNSDSAPTATGLTDVNLSAECHL